MQKMSGFIRAKSSLGNSYGEEKDYVFSMDDHDAENGWILALMGKKKFMS